MSVLYTIDLFIEALIIVGDRKVAHAPPLLVIVSVVHPSTCPHDVCHLLKEDVVVSLHC